MPRRRPRALRAEHISRRPLPDESPVHRIHGLSRRATLVVRRVELLSDDYYLYPGATEKAIREYRAFLRPPGRRPLYPQNADCGCRGCSFDDVRHARDMLEKVLTRLPPRERAELRRLVRPLDAQYRRRTLPDPFVHRRKWCTEFWWYRCLTANARDPMS